MRHVKYPQPIERIIAIVSEFYAFGRLSVRQTAEQYGVSTKTIRRDFQKISQIIPIASKRGKYWIDTDRLLAHQCLPTALLRGFASNAGLKIDCLADPTASIPVISFAIAYNGIDASIAEPIIRSIERGEQCRFDYTNNRGEHSRRIVSPLHLFTEKSKWYLIAKDHKTDTIRSFDFLKITAFTVLAGTRTQLTAKEIAEAQTWTSVWHSSDSEPFGVRLHVDKYAKRYVEEVPLHHTQSLEELHIDGGAVMAYTVTHPMELLPAVKTWIPHIHILSPDTLRQQLMGDVEVFWDEMKQMDT